MKIELKLEVHPHKSLYNVSQTWRRHISSGPAFVWLHGTPVYRTSSRSVRATYQTNKKNVLLFLFLLWKAEENNCQLSKKTYLFIRDDILSLFPFLTYPLSLHTVHPIQKTYPPRHKSKQETSCLSLFMHPIKCVLNYFIFFDFLQVLYKLLNILLVGLKPGTSGWLRCSLTYQSVPVCQVLPSPLVPPCDKVWLTYSPTIYFSNPEVGCTFPSSPSPWNPAVSHYLAFRLSFTILPS